MKTIHHVVTLAIIIGTSSGGIAQSPNQTPSDPSAASSPHQRQATGSSTTEMQGSNGADPSDASSPHQREAVQGPSQGHGAMSMQGQESPASFVKKAAQDGMTEVELGRVAASKSSNAAVKQFAQRMVQDHGKANHELAGIAKAKHLEVPTQLDSEHQSMVKALSAKSGSAFDADYAAHMAADHDKAIALFQSESTSSDPELAGFAKETLPTLQEHKRIADSLRSNTRQGSSAARTQ
jgi:putative membrane protein